MSDRIDEEQRENMPDIIRLIRSVQGMEGNPECFATAVDGCDRLECLWREYCFKESVKNKK
jgi:hypothetical protein